MREVGLIPEGVDVGEDMILRISPRISSTTEVFNWGLDMMAIELNN